VRIDVGGDLLVRRAGAVMRHRKPTIYQESDRGRREIEGRYVRRGSRSIGFEVSAYDRTRALIIDPVLLYATYLGGTGSDSYVHGAIAVDAAGSAYVAGTTQSADFPVTEGAHKTSLGGSCDITVSKLTPTGSGLVYSSYLGGSGSDCEGVGGIAVDASGNAYVAGWTDIDSDYPATPGSLQLGCPAPVCVGKGVLTKLNPAGSALVYSATLAGVPLGAVAIGSDGNAYVAGGSAGDVFVARVNASGSALIYGRTLGGTRDDGASGIAVDPAGDAYVTGTTESSDFPTTPGAFQQSCPQRPTGSCFIAFVFRIDATGSALVYSTYLGGETSVQLQGTSSMGTGIAVDQSGHAYVTGIAFSSDFPTTPGAFQVDLGGDGNDAFVSKLNAAGSGLVYSTFLGGAGFDGAEGIGVDDAGNAYVVGFTGSIDFPTTNAFQSALRSSYGNAFVAKLDPTGSALVYSSYFGGSVGDIGRDVAVDGDGVAYITGYTGSTDIPLVAPLQGSFGGGATDGFVAKIGEPSCGRDVSGSVDIFRLPVLPILFTPLRWELVIIRNRAATPIAGPLAYVLDDLQNGVFIGSLLTTRCISPEGDPFAIVRTGADDVLSPGEYAFAGLWFFKIAFDPLSYVPHLLSAHSGS
jgi:Beta-propeller repeat